SGEQTMSLVVRSDAPSDTIVRAVKSAIWSVDKDQPIYNVRTMDGIISGLAGVHRLAFILLAVLALLAVTLGAIGIYGVTSYVVGQRTQEIGIRMALGAQGRDVVAMLLLGGARLALTGVAAGLACALVVGRLLQSLLYGVEPYDAMTLVAASLGL